MTDEPEHDIVEIGELTEYLRSIATQLNSRIQEPKTKRWAQNIEAAADELERLNEELEEVRRERDDLKKREEEPNDRSDKQGPKIDKETDKLGDNLETFVEELHETESGLGEIGDLEELGYYVSKARTLLPAAADRLESMAGGLDYLKGRVTELAAEKSRLKEELESTDTVPACELEAGDVVRFPDGREVEILDSMEGSSPTSWLLRSRDYENRADYAGEFPCRFPFERIEAASGEEVSSGSSGEAASGSSKQQSKPQSSNQSSFEAQSKPQSSTKADQSSSELADELERIANTLDLATTPTIAEVPTDDFNLAAATATIHRAAEALRKKGGTLGGAVRSAQSSNRGEGKSQDEPLERGYVQKSLDNLFELREMTAEDDDVVIYELGKCAARVWVEHDESQDSFSIEYKVEGRPLVRLRPPTDDGRFHDFEEACEALYESVQRDVQTQKAALVATMEVLKMDEEVPDVDG
ncbi:MAG: hypothetical protein ABEH81_16275 [Halopenitus sp.]